MHEQEKQQFHKRSQRVLLGVKMRLEIIRIIFSEKCN